MNLLGKYKNILHYLTSLKEVIFNGYPARKIKVIGVTGTDGKTTTSHLIYEILKAEGYPVALISTLGAFVGEEKIDTGFHVTTPDAKLLQPLIKKIVQKGARYLVLETTSHGLDQYRTLGCNFWIGVLTNVTNEHLDYHGTFEKYRAAKGKLFRKIKIAVLNKDDPSFNFFRAKASKTARILTYSLNQQADLKASKIAIEKGYMNFVIKDKKKLYSVKSGLLGDYNVSNILAASLAARVCGVSWEKIILALNKFEGVKGRMETIDVGQAFSVIVDFAHTPNALEKVLLTLRKISYGKARIICVFGCAGERDTLKRPAMGKISAKLADVTIFTAEDPRHEKVSDIIDKMAEGAISTGAVEINPEQGVKTEGKHNVFLRIEDRKKAIRYAIKDVAKPGDIVIICGKGHEKSLAYGDKEIPWSDQAAARESLKN